MNIGVWIGFLLAALLVGWGVTKSGSVSGIVNLHGVLTVIGGTFAAIIINCPPARLWSALKGFGNLFLPTGLPSIEEIITEMVRLAKKAQMQGGLLSIQEDARDFAGGFLHRAILVAIATAETTETRRILEAEIRQIRVVHQEDANVFRTIGVLSPMFGLLGTLLGMIQVLETMSEPTKVGPAMALALSSAFVGIALANFICIPIAGLIRLRAMSETLILEMILEGGLDIAGGKAPYLIELHLSSYSQQRRRELEAAETALTRPAGAPARE